jgi:hypothetical protein
MAGSLFTQAAEAATDVPLGRVTPLENPEEFDGFRYHNLRQKEGNEAKYQFATIGSDALSSLPSFCLKL